MNIYNAHKKFISKPPVVRQDTSNLIIEDMILGAKALKMYYIGKDFFLFT